MRLLLIVLLFVTSARAQIEVGDFFANFESGNVADVRQVGADSFAFAIMLDNNPGDTLIDYIDAGDFFRPKVWDFDQRDRATLTIAAVCRESADSEAVALTRQNADGLFASALWVPTDSGPAVPGDGVVSIGNGGTLELAYIDPGLPARAFHRYLPVGAPCSHNPGDVNNNGIRNGADIVYFVHYLKGGLPPRRSCECAEHGPLYVAADANGDCMANGQDVLYIINYFKGGPGILFCSDCPPENW